MKLQKALNFLRLTDPDGTLSLTSIALIIVLVKLAIAPVPSLPELGALLLALAARAHKKILVDKHQKADESLTDAVKKHADEVKKLSDKVQVIDNRTRTNSRVELR